MLDYLKLIKEVLNAGLLYEMQNQETDEYFEDWIKSDTECSPKGRGIKDIEDRIGKIIAIRLLLYTDMENPI